MLAEALDQESDSMARASQERDELSQDVARLRSQRDALHEELKESRQAQAALDRQCGQYAEQIAKMVPVANTPSDAVMATDAAVSRFQ